MFAAAAFVVYFASFFLFCTLPVQQEEPKAARLVQEYTN